MSETTPPDVRPGARNRRVAIIAASVAVGMVGMSFASVPLYRLFCQVTGFDGTTQRATAAPRVASAQTIRVRFDANTDPNLPWDFAPKQKVVTIRVGEQGLAFYSAHNRDVKATWGHATYNVTPEFAGKYFQKIQCFCFNDQKLAAGEAVDMPVIYFVDPAILNDPYARGLREITLSYTFFPQETPATEVAAQVTGAGSVN